MRSLDSIVRRMAVEKARLDSEINWYEKNLGHECEEIRQQKLHIARTERQEMKRILYYMGIDFNAL